MAPQSAIPPILPPSVEEAYRRKCVQLRNRTKEVEESNDAARLRLSRIKRQVEKIRIERAFLLEQLAKRTSTNVEDSDGSPSPPPTPQDKPLRLKKGHRKSEAAPDQGAASGAAADSAAPEADKDGETTAAASQVAPADAAEMFKEHLRPKVEAKAKESEEDVNVDEELARAWEELPADEQAEWHTKWSKAFGTDNDENDNDENENDKAETQDEDVEMANDDGAEQEEKKDVD